MIKIGKLYRYAENSHVDIPLVEVNKTWDKRDIDPYCPESVAIVPMVTFTYLTGPKIGRTRSVRRRVFYTVAQEQK